jgi:DNA adenine methylase
VFLHKVREQKKQIGSFIKWAGGKGQLIDQYLSFFPQTLAGRHYVEPFVGSGAIFFYVIQNLHPSSCTLLDINPELINTWRTIRDNVEELIILLTEHKNFHNKIGITERERKEYYYMVRAQDISSCTARAARFIYLNKTCFNGLHRLNSKGKFNVPMGNYKEPGIFDADHLRQVSQFLDGVTIETCHFHNCERFVADGSFVYVDPPYEPLSYTSSFTSYAKDAFTKTNQQELRDILAHLGNRADYMLSNSTALLIEDLYASPEFYKHRVLARRTINSVATKRGKIEELLITNYSTVKSKAQLSIADTSAATAQ